MVSLTMPMKGLGSKDITIAMRKLRAQILASKYYQKDLGLLKKWLTPVPEQRKYKIAWGIFWARK